MKLRRTLVSAVLATASALAFIVLPGTPALAVPQCSVKTLENSNLNFDFLWVPVSSSGVHACQMGYGAVSDAVWALQRSLKYCYGQSISVDGQFGDNTKAALKVAQKAIGADQDGTYGPQTAGLIKFSARDNTAKSDCSRPIYVGGS